MITIENQCEVFYRTVTNGTEYAITNSGVWKVHTLHELAAGTGAVVYLPDLEDGSTLSVDVGGNILVNPGPDLTVAATAGLSVAFTVIGIILMIRWIARVFHAGARIRNEALE